MRINSNQFRLDYIDRDPPQNETKPAGPFRQAQAGEECSLLIFVPRNFKSVLINAFTGRYGYSHMAVDCGELDVPTGKRVMIESTVGVGVHYGFQDEYGERNFVRIPLDGVIQNTLEFCNCIRSKLGEKYDTEEALTFGLLRSPARQICSDLITVCLPETMLMDITRRHKANQLQSRSAVRAYGHLNKDLRLFVSPNGFAEYFGAPRGEYLQGPDQLYQPVLAASGINH